MQAIAVLKGHEEAGPLIRKLEDWLHRPPGDRLAEPVDVAELLRPYRDLPSEALEREPASALVQHAEGSS